MEKINLLDIDPKDYERALIGNEILHWFDLCDAAWVHDGDSKKPHAELTSGMCSNGFFDCMRVLKYPNLAEILGWQLACKLQSYIYGNVIAEEVDWVIGSAYAAITFSHEVAKALKTIHGFVEKDSADPKGKKMLWARLRS